MRLALVAVLALLSGCAPAVRAPTPTGVLTPKDLCELGPRYNGQRVQVLGLVSNRFEDYFLLQSAEEYRRYRSRFDEAGLCRVILLDAVEGLPPHLTYGIMTGRFELKRAGMWRRVLHYEGMTWTSPSEGVPKSAPGPVVAP